MNKTRGVYFVANDRVIEITIAFLSSFRKFNPEIPLCMIPFRSDVEKLTELQHLFNFTIFDDHDALSFFDEISRQFHGNIIGHYRKLAIWQGHFEEFVYIDIDTLILKNIDFAFRILKHFDFITSCSNIPSTKKWVWKESVHQTDALSLEQINYAANTGFIVSKKNAISLEDIRVKLPEALQIKDHMELRCMDQSFINYLIVTSDKMFTSLVLLMDTPLYPENYVEFWAGNRNKDLLQNMQTRIDGRLRDIFLIHWAGKWQLKNFEIRLFIILSILKIRKTIWSTSILMPFRRLWKRYRYMDVGTGRRSERRDLNEEEKRRRRDER